MINDTNSNFPQQSEPLAHSIPANNWKIIEIFNKIRSNQLIVNPDYQRKLVWKRQHKIDFIDTIIKNYPFPEVYFTSGNLDQERLILIDEIVDGQQRLNTIRDYILGQDIFALPKISIQKFSELTPEQKSSFLNYEVSVRYLKSTTQTQVKEIFKRINKTDYALNRTERINAQWGESDFICFCKQIVDPQFDPAGSTHKIDEQNKNLFLNFFHGEEEYEEGIFSLTDKNRMLALQYLMTLVATMDHGAYFARNDKTDSYIQGFNDAFPHAAAVEQRLAKVIYFLNCLPLKRNARWFNKANLFTLTLELDKFDTEKIDATELARKLDEFDMRASLCELGVEDANEKLSDSERKYLDYAREAVNQKAAREYRGQFVSTLLTTSTLLL